MLCCQPELNLMEMAAEEYQSSCQPDENRWSYNCFSEREKSRSSAGISQNFKKKKNTQHFDLSCSLQVNNGLQLSCTAILSWSGSLIVPEDTSKYLSCCLRSKRLWLPKDQMQRNTTARLVLGSLIGMEDTEEMHKVKRIKVKNEKCYSSYLNNGLNTVMCVQEFKVNTNSQVHMV